MSDNTGTTFTTVTGDAWGLVNPPRTVKPRTRKYVHMPLVAVVDGELVTEDGEHARNLPVYFRSMEPTIVVTLEVSHFLSTLHAAHGDDPTWRYTLYRTHSQFGDGSVARVKLTTFGFRGEGARRQRLHQCWDPRSYSPDVSARFLDGGDPGDLLRWAIDVRTWAQEQDLELRNAFAGYGAQLLRDPRFYPEPRRRVPRATNERARPALPGNLITLSVPPGPTPHTVVSIDQKSAHHQIVQDIPLPSSNHLFARGYFNDPENAEGYWVERDTPLWTALTTYHHGLLYVGLHSRMSGKRERGLRLPIQEYQGYKREFIWTNQLTWLESTGTYIDGVFAAWTSTSVDEGLSLYGKFAASQIASASPARKKWLKPLLHSAYGLLAARPRPLEVGHRTAGHSPHTFLLGAREFPVKGVKLDAVTPQFVNVVQRGMIEAETQLRSLRMANDLTSQGCEVLHVHSDGLHVRGNLPLLPDTWSVSPLTDVLYIDRVSWVSAERVCLPGRDQSARHAQIVHHGQVLADSARSRRERGLRSHLPWSSNKLTVTTHGPRDDER